jgi:putative ABC transport system permease protein
MGDALHESRQLAKNYGYTAVAVAVLGLSIAINTVIFSGAEAVLFRPLPYDDSACVVHVWSTNPQNGVDRSPVSPPDFADLKKNLISFETLSAFYTQTATLSWQWGYPERISGARASSDLFRTLAVQPRAGRTFTTDEDRPGGPNVVVISDGLWRRFFGGDPAILGKSITLDGKDHTIVGVMGPGFWFPSRNVDLWLPLQLAPLEHQRSDRFLILVGRLKPGAPREIAEAEASRIAAQLAHQYPDTNAAWGASVVRLRDERLSGRAREALFIMLAAVACVLVIGCANVANLILERMAYRQQEFAVRVALGAGRWRLIRQMVVHCAALSFLGALLGLALTALGTALLSSAIPPYLRDYRDFGFDSHMLGFNIFLPVLTSLLCAIVPAIQLSRVDLVGVLREGGVRGASRGIGGGAFGLLVTLEVALSLVMLIGTGLAIRGFLRILTFDWGFRAANVLTFRIELPNSKYPDADRKEHFFNGLLAECKTIPGVVGVSAVDALPVSGRVSRSGAMVLVWRAGQPARHTQQIASVLMHVVRPAYFEVMGISLLQGRDFNDRDTHDNVPVAIISDSLARHYFGRENPIGQRLDLGHSSTQSETRVVVGAVRSIPTRGPDRPEIPELYVPYAQNQMGGMTVVLRTSPEPTNIVGAVRSRVKALDVDIAVDEVASMQTVLGESYAGPHIFIWMMGVFGALALLIAAAGMYSVVSYDVARRTHEIGIRMALGAQPKHVYRLIGGRTLRLLVRGALIGIPGGIALSRGMTSLLFGISPFDPVVHLLLLVLLMAVGLAACYGPVKRALRVDPSFCLRAM